MSEEKIIVIKRKKAAHHAHHGGAWKVAYADFVTAMMAFFMVMWLMGTDQETMKAIEAYFKTGQIARNGISASGAFNGGDARANVGAEGRFEEKNLEQPHHQTPIPVEEYSILKDLSTMYEGAAFSTVAEGEWVKYTLKPRLRFPAGSVHMNNDEANRKVLMNLMEVFREHDGPIVIEGYADDKTDWTLAYHRALSVLRFLEESGIRKDKLIPVTNTDIRDDGLGVAPVAAIDAGTVRFTLKRKRDAYETERFGSI